MIALFLAGTFFILGSQAGGKPADPGLEAALRKMEQRDYVGALVDLEKYATKPATRSDGILPDGSVSDRAGPE